MKAKSGGVGRSGMPARKTTEQSPSVKPTRRSKRPATPARAAIAAAAAELGGVERLVAWIREDTKNESVFWASIYPKLIALQLDGEEGGPPALELVVRFV
jgi:hypothetical protein